MGTVCSTAEPTDVQIKGGLKPLTADQLKEKYEAAGQGHVFQQYADLDGDMKRMLEQQANMFEPL